jgi:propionyl-CoA carboxylase beta chain
LPSTAGGVPVEGGVEAAFKRDLEAIADPVARETEAKRIQVGIESLHDRFRTAEHFGIQEIIDPRETR